MTAAPVAGPSVSTPLRILPWITPLPHDVEAATPAGLRDATAPEEPVAARAPPRAAPRFARATTRRTHDLRVLGIAIALVGLLVALGTWMTLDVAEGHARHVAGAR
jgi:hypothetical protein